MAKDTKIIFVGNYKGGVGKTTSVLNFAEYFSKYKDKEYKVLVLDLDPQSSLSEILVSKGKGNVRDLDKWKEEETLNYVFDLWITKIEKYNNIELKFNTESLIKKYHGFDFIPSNLFIKIRTTVWD